MRRLRRRPPRRKMIRNKFISHTHLFNFLHKNVVLAAVTGFCDSHGGPGAMMSYIMQLFGHCSSERVAVIVETDFLLRSHMARMSAAGQHFDVAVESEKRMAHFLSQARSRVESQFLKDQQPKKSLSQNNDKKKYVNGQTRRVYPDSGPYNASYPQTYYHASAYPQNPQGSAPGYPMGPQYPQSFPYGPPNAYPSQPVQGAGQPLSYPAGQQYIPQYGQKGEKN